jgi:hypothetical protein
MERTLPIVFRAGRPFCQMPPGDRPVARSSTCTAMIERRHRAHRMRERSGREEDSRPSVAARLPRPSRKRDDPRRDDKKAEKPAEGRVQHGRESAEAKPTRRTETKAEYESSRKRTSGAAPCGARLDRRGEILTSPLRPRPPRTARGESRRRRSGARARSSATAAPLRRGRSRTPRCWNEHGVPFALTTAGADGPKKFFERLRVAVKAACRRTPRCALSPENAGAPVSAPATSSARSSRESSPHVVAFDSGLPRGRMRRCATCSVDGPQVEMKAKPKEEGYPRLGTRTRAAATRPASAAPGP